MQMAPFISWIRTSAWLACAWRATLVSPSCATRKRTVRLSLSTLFTAAGADKLTRIPVYSLKVFMNVRTAGSRPKSSNYRRAEFTSESMHCVYRLLHRLLSAGNASLQALGVERGLPFQVRQPDIDARQALGDDIMQFATDLLSLFLLRRQKLAGQQPQLFLHPPRLLQQPRVVLLAFPERFLRRLALGDFLFQLPVGGGQIRAAPVEGLIQL